MKRILVVILFSGFISLSGFGQEAKEFASFGYSNMTKNITIYYASGTETIEVKDKNNIDSEALSILENLSSKGWSLISVSKGDGSKYFILERTK